MHFDDIDSKTSKVSTKFYRSFRQRLVEVLQFIEKEVYRNRVKLELNNVE